MLRAVCGSYLVDHPLFCEVYGFCLQSLQALWQMCGGDAVTRRQARHTLLLFRTLRGNRVRSSVQTLPSEGVELLIGNSSAAFYAALMCNLGI